MYIRIAFFIELRLRVSRSLRSLANDTVAIAINKLCELNFRYFTMYLAISQQQGNQGFKNMVLIFLRL